MAEVKVEQEIGASADRVWKLMRDFGGLKAWSPGIESCEVEGEGIGAVRTIKMGTISLKERLEYLDDATRTFRYSIVEGPIPVSEYLATVSVSEAGPDRARAGRHRARPAPPRARRPSRAEDRARLERGRSPDRRRRRRSASSRFP